MILTPVQLARIRRTFFQWLSTPVPPCGIPHNHPYNPCLAEQVDSRPLMCVNCGLRQRPQITRGTGERTMPDTDPEPYAGWYRPPSGNDPGLAFPPRPADLVTSDQAAAAYIERLIRHRHGRPPEWYFAAKVAGEAAEAQEAWMQLEGWSRHPGTLEHLAEELADTEISARALAQLYGIDLDAAIARKHRVLMARDLRAGSDPIEGES